MRLPCDGLVILRTDGTVNGSVTHIGPAALVITSWLARPRRDACQGLQQRALWLLGVL